MRGTGHRLRMLATALVAALFLVPPSAGVAALDDRVPTAQNPVMGPGATDTSPQCPQECLLGPHLSDILDQAPVGDLPRLLRRAVGPTPMDAPAAPDHVPGYSALDPETKREAWRVWAVGAQFAAAAPLSPFPGLPSGTGSGSEGGSDDQPGDLGDPFGLRELWRVESHGMPREVLPAGDDGETFLVTSQGVLRFSAPGAAPDWMVKPGGFVTKVRTTDADGDGVRDLVIGTFSFALSDDASILVVDGRTGDAVYRGMGAMDRLVSWELGDVDADGDDEVVGLTAALQIVAVELDGTEVYRADTRELPSLSASPGLLVYAFVTYTPYGGSLFGDADGDGVPDLFLVGDYWAFVLAVIANEMVDAPILMAYSGTDGSLLWLRPTQPSAGFAWLFPRATGDLDGDGSDDLVAWRFQFSSVGLVFTWAIGYDVFSGVDGRYLARDGDSVVCVFLVCAPEVQAADRYVPLVLVDLDRDGAEELLTLEVIESGSGVASMEIVGRGAPLAGFVQTTELYRYPLVMDGFAVLDGQFRVRDVDQDGAPELLAYILGFDTDGRGNVTDIATSVFSIGADGVDGFQAPRLMGYYDVDEATGQAYGWTLPDDRWVPLDDDGNRIGHGLRLVISARPVAVREHTGDGVPDVLLPKATGFMWADGRTGRLLEDVTRPAGRFALTVVEEADQLRVLERSYASDQLYLARLDKGTDVWAFRPEGLDQSYLLDYVDATGDGLADVAMSRWQCADSCWDEVRVYDMARRELVLSERTDAWQARFGDAVPSRAGHELLLTDQDPRDFTKTLRVLAPGVEEPMWRYPLGGSGFLADVRSGTVLVGSYGEGLALEFVEGTSGEQLAAFATEADAWETGILLHDVDGDPAAEAVVTIIVQDEEWGVQGQRVIILDPDTASELSTFALSAPPVVRIAFLGGVFEVYDAAHVTTPVGDWDGDGLVDFAYRELGFPVVRSSADGEVLALAPMRGTAVVDHDLNGDGLPELGVVTDYGALRFMARSGTADTVAREAPVQVVADPQATQDGHDVGFFEEEKSSVPGPGVALAALACAFLAFALRRRR